ncbi:MAG: hypothetical protein ACLGHN_09355 [Bacteriovoracia bacterium]
MAGEKILHRMSKRASKPGSSDPRSSSPGSKKLAGKADELKNQYDLIREDILKLRTDLQKGYDMAKGFVDKKTLKQLLKAK